MVVYFFSCFQPGTTIKICSSARCVTSPVCPKIGGVPLEVVEAGALKGEGAFESFVVEGDLFVLNGKAELGAPLEVDAEGHAKVDQGASAGLSDTVVSLVDPYPKANLVPVLGEEAGIVVPKEFDNLMLVPNPPRPVFGTGKDHRQLKGQMIQSRQAEY